MANTCRVTSDLHRWEDDQARNVQEEPTAAQIEEQMQILIKDRFHDAEDYDTTDAFQKCKAEWKAVASIPKAENVFSLGIADAMHRLSMLNNFKNAMEKAFRDEVMHIAEERAQEEANQ